MSVETARVLPGAGANKAASSPTPSRVWRVGRRKYLSIKANSEGMPQYYLPCVLRFVRGEGLLRRCFGRTQLRGEFVEHAVDELVSVGAAEGLGEFDRFVDDDPPGRLEMVAQFAGRHQKNAALDGRNLVPGAFDMRFQRGPQGGQIVEDAVEQTIVERSVRFFETGNRFRMHHDGGRVLAAHQVLIKTLYNELAGAMARTARGFLLRVGAHLTAFRNTIWRLAISTAHWAASIPFCVMRTSA